MDKEYTVTWKLWAYQYDDDFTSDSDEDDDTYWKKLKENAVKLCKNTAKDWEFFANDKFTVSTEFNDVKKIATCQLTGFPNKKNFNDLVDWATSIRFFLVDKGTHEQSEEGKLDSDGSVVVRISFNDEEFLRKYR